MVLKLVQGAGCAGRPAEAGRPSSRPMSGGSRCGLTGRCAAALEEGRMIERRMGLHQIHDHTQYLRFLHEHPQEIEALFHELLIGVTSFFRDPGEWERLRHEVLPALVTQRAPGGALRAWVPGCSTGEEAYSLAIVFREMLDPIKTLRNINVQIFATDLDRRAIEKARLGIYPENIAADVSPERLRPCLVRDDRGSRVSKDIRESVVFAPQNVLVDPPFTKVDILSCRNLLIYLSAEVQRRLIPLFHYCLNPGGALFLGSAETVGGFGARGPALRAVTRVHQGAARGRTRGHRAGPPGRHQRRHPAREPDRPEAGRAQGAGRHGDHRDRRARETTRGGAPAAGGPLPRPPDARAD